MSSAVSYACGETLSRKEHQDWQKELSNCRSGDHLFMMLSSYDPERVNIYTTRGVSIGFVPKEQKPSIAAEMRAGRIRDASILSILGSEPYVPSLGACIQATQTWSEDLD